MAITLADAKLNAQEDYDAAVIDEFRKSSALLNLLQYDTAVNPAGGGATLEYGYRRLKTQRGAAFRDVNTEYKDENVTTEKHTVELKVLGGSFSIDRVLADIGAQATGEIALQISQLAKSTNAKFCDAVINGDSAVETAGFDGLDKALKDSATEIGKDTEVDWTTIDGPEAANKIIDTLDEFLANLDGAPTVILANKRVIAKLRAAARRAGMYTKNPVDDLISSNGQPLMQEYIGGAMILDPGAKAGTNDDIIPVTGGKTSLYAVRFGLDGFHGVTTTSGQMVRTWLPDFSTAGAVKRGEVELGPVAVALKATKAAAVLRNVKISAA